MSEPTALRDDQPTPWYPCPECGGVWLRVTATLERGNWVDSPDRESIYVIKDNDTPRVTTYISNTPDEEPPAIECNSCGHRFNMPSSDLGNDENEEGGA